MEENLSNEVIYVKEKDGVQYIKFKALEKYKDRVKCIFTLKDLDFGFRTASKEEINSNYMKVCNIIGERSENVVRPNQTHTANVVKLDDNVIDYSKGLEDVDGIITDKKNIVLSLMFADCTPIALYDPIKNVIGNIHSGWRGTLNAIGINAVNMMHKEYGCNLDDIICIIGPTIRKCHFEVDKDVRDLFYDKYNYLDNIDEIIKEKKVDNLKYNIDTALLNKTLLKNAGLKDENIIDTNICTVCRVDMFPSYRKEKELSKRSTLIMCLK